VLVIGASLAAAAWVARRLAAGEVQARADPGEGLNAGCRRGDAVRLKQV